MSLLSAVNALPAGSINQKQPANVQANNDASVQASSPGVNVNANVHQGVQGVSDGQGVSINQQASIGVNISGGSGGVATSTPTASTTASTSSSITSSITSTPFTTFATTTTTVASIITSATSSSNPTPFISGQGVLGIAYDAFMLPDQSCRSSSEITADFTQMFGYGYQTVRLYGVECNQIQIAVSAAAGRSNALYLGVYNIGTYQQELASLISQVNGNWGPVAAVTVFNEAVNDGLATVDQVAAAIQYAKQVLTQAGYTGPVTTVDTFVAYYNNPSLCNVGDFVGANIQPYFDGNVDSAGAGSFVAQQKALVEQTCQGQKVVVTGKRACFIMSLALLTMYRSWMAKQWGCKWGCSVLN